VKRVRKQESINYNMRLKGYKDLNIWERSIEVVEDIYKITKNFPEEEIYRLASQLRRSAVSIPSNSLIKKLDTD